uniref:site-specific DNA-methyltransferase n=1 Tax=Candidatus Saccharicenans sp. TaxID=2819258 RepID=UPI004049EBB1
MRKLSEQEIEQIVSLLREGKPLPEDYKAILFDTKKEYELIYADKEREEDILADTMAVPLQAVKTFRNGKNGNGWTNMLIFGDNLQVLKTLLQMKQEGKIKNADGTPGVRLVYIDPPFATRQEFRGSQDQKAYQDKIAGARFLEFLRKRLVFLRELLSEDGSIYVHLDWHMGHYIKTIIDEVFGQEKFKNEIVVSRIKKSDKNIQKFNTATDMILFYTKSNNSFIFNSIGHKTLTKKYWHALDAPGQGEPRIFFGKKLAPPSGRHWMWDQRKIDEAIERGELRLHPKTERPEYLVGPGREQILDSNWTDISAYSFSWQFPTEKNEALLDRIIKASSNPGDLVLDCFAGSGTTLAVAEKLGRRWIGVDCGKLAIYTMQKRLLNIAESKDLEDPKKKYGKSCKPFTLYNAGLYDYKMIKELPW